jgi:hypothetical protein
MRDLGTRSVPCSKAALFTYLETQTNSRSYILTCHPALYSYLATIATNKFERRFIFHSETLDTSSSTMPLEEIQQDDITPLPPPDGGYGWVCVLGQFLINGFTWGVAAVSLSTSTST